MEPYMPFEIHRGVENADHLKNPIINAKEDHMPALRRYLTAGKQVRPKAIGWGIRQDFLKTLP